MRPRRDIMPGRRGGGCEIRTREGLHPTRFPSVRPRPLGESSAGKLTRIRRWLGCGDLALSLSTHLVLSLTTLADDPPHGVYPANPPRAGRQQGYAGSDGCAGGPSITSPDHRWGWADGSRRVGT